MVDINSIIDTLKKMEGSVAVFPVSPESKDKIWAIERDLKGSLGIAVRNTGLQECLQRQYIICIVKDRRFRPPPEPTVLLIGDDDTVLGEEVVPATRSKFEGREDLIFLSEEFVIYPERKPTMRECFLMPPVSFPELESVSGLRDVVSCSPSAPADVMLRTLHGLEDNPKYASILVGFNVQNGF